MPCGDRHTRVRENPLRASDVAIAICRRRRDGSAYSSRASGMAITICLGQRRRRRVHCLQLTICCSVMDGVGFMDLCDMSRRTFHGLPMG